MLRIPCWLTDWGSIGSSEGKQGKEAISAMPFPLFHGCLVAAHIFSSSVSQAPDLRSTGLSRISSGALYPTHTHKGPPCPVSHTVNLNLDVFSHGDSLSCQPSPGITRYSSIHAALPHSMHIKQYLLCTKWSPFLRERERQRKWTWKKMQFTIAEKAEQVRDR